jgi:hypothetical protein
MLRLVKDSGAYDPETVAVMTAAFDTICGSLSNRMIGNDDVKEMLALIILRHIGQGERDPARLADVAYREWAGADRSVAGYRAATK